MDAWYSLPGFHQPLSSMSHLAGAAVFAFLAFYLVRPVWRDWSRLVCVLIFAASAVVLLSLSGLYHMFAQGGYIRAVMLRLDVAAIFILIAASFTPIHGILFTGWKRWGVLGVVWTIAIVGITLRSIYFESVPKVLGASVFLMMGWIGIVTAYLLWREIGWRAVIPAVAGGVIYSFGAIVNIAAWPVVIPFVWGPHETLHFAVLGGLACHWYIVSQIVNGFPSGAANVSIPWRSPLPEPQSASVSIELSPAQESRSVHEQKRSA